MTNLWLQYQFFDKLTVWEIITFDKDDKKYYWSNMIGCGLAPKIVLTLITDVVAGWEAQGISNMKEFKTIQGMTSEEVKAMVHSQVDSYLCKLLGVIEST
ncbi:hypothetical protein BGX38DRAFT_1275513 [Terfezia claveryi]|nr:hypothetical protein BGX38DRAFT_1275513 [Terfezia claveryi]